MLGKFKFVLRDIKHYYSQQQGFIQLRKSGKIVVTTAEKKLLFVVCYFGIFGIILLTAIANQLAEVEIFNKALEMYFFCELQGLPNECHRRSIERYSKFELNLLLVITAVSLPVTQMLYIVNFKQMKGWMIGVTGFKKNMSTNIELVEHQ